MVDDAPPRAKRSDDVRPFFGERAVPPFISFRPNQDKEIFLLFDSPSIAIPVGKVGISKLKKPGNAGAQNHEETQASNQPTVSFYDKIVELFCWSFGYAPAFSRR